MKKLSNQEMKKIAKSTLALVLAGTFTFSPIALAEENTSEYETVELQTTENLNTTASPEVIEEAKTQVDDLEETNPSLIPGDFFYFAKIALEKIRLAFTFDNAKEAELLATYAAERLAEASALFAEGKEDEALKVIEDAVVYMENSQDIVDEETGNDDEIEEGSDVEAGTEQGDSEVGTEEETDSEEGESAEEEVPTDDVDEEDTTADDEAEEEVVENPFEGIENVLRQNIIALTAAMEKVQNPTARAALQKNIDKTYAKMAKKLAKIEEKYAEQPEEEEITEETTEPVDVAPVVESDLQPADEIEEPTEESAEETMPMDDDTVAVPVVAPVKSVKEVKQQQKAEKAAVKQENKAAKHEAKQQKKDSKSHDKEDRQEGIKSQKHEQKGNSDKGNGKGKENN